MRSYLITLDLDLACLEEKCSSNSVMDINLLLGEYDFSCVYLSTITIQVSTAKFDCFYPYTSKVKIYHFRKKVKC